MLWGICHGSLGPPRGFAGRSLLGYQTQRAAGSAPGGADSLKTRFTPNAVAGDVYITSVWTSSLYRLNVRQDGTYWYDTPRDPSQQLVLADLYAIATGLNGEGTLAINDSPPRVSSPSGTLFGNGTLTIGQPVSIPAQAQDPQGQAITYTVHSGSMPPGLGIDGTTGLTTGTPTTYGSYGFTVRMADPFGAYSDTVEQLTIAAIVPDFTGQLYSAAQAILAPLSVTSSSTSVSSSLPTNTIISQSLPPGTVINTSGVSISFDVSNGATFTTVPNLFPITLKGVTFESTRTVEFNNSFQGTITGKVSTMAYMQYPIIHWDLNYDILNQAVALDELKQIEGLFNQKQAQAGTFLYLDPEFNTVTNEKFGTGDGTTKQFQLIAAYGNSGGPSTAEIVQQLQAAPTLFDNGSLVSSSNYTIGPTGIVTFNTAPTSGHILTWSGSFYYLAQFETDDISPEEFLNRFWQLDTLKLKSVIQ